MQLPDIDSFLLIAAHLGSKLHQSVESQTLAAPLFNATIVRIAEKKTKHNRTLIVGDLNMNPFDAAMVGAEGFNAVMTRDAAQQEDRRIGKQTYPFFYNPMWSHFGDSTHELYPPGHPDHQPAGTCYYSPRESRWYYWNMSDQVLIRPELLPFFRNQDLKIIVTDGVTSLLTNRGLPNRTLASDHFPIRFRLHL